MLRGQIEVTGTLQYSRASRVLVGSPPSTARVLDEFSSTREALAGLCLAAAAHAIDIPNKAQHRLLPRGIVHGTSNYMDIRSRFTLDPSWEASAKLNCLLRIINRYDLSWPRPQDNNFIKISSDHKYPEYMHSAQVL